MAFSLLKITLFQLKITFSQLKIDARKFFEQKYLFFRNHQSPITHCQNYQGKLIFSRVGYVCPWRPNVIYWRQKMYWNPISIFPFRPNYVILEMYLPLLPTKIFVQDKLIFNSWPEICAKSRGVWSDTELQNVVDMADKNIGRLWIVK